MCLKGEPTLLLDGEDSSDRHATRKNNKRAQFRFFFISDDLFAVLLRQILGIPHVHLHSTQRQLVKLYDLLTSIKFSKSSEAIKISHH